MTFEELEKKYEDLQKDFLQVDGELKTTKEEKTTIEEDYKTFKSETETTIADYKERHDTLVEHNNNLFRQVTQPQEKKKEETEKTPNELLENVLNNFN